MSNLLLALLLALAIVVSTGAIAYGYVRWERAHLPSHTSTVERVSPTLDGRVLQLETAIGALQSAFVATRQMPIVELWLMDQNESSIEHTIHVATRLRTPEVNMDGATYIAARESQPGYWIYRRLH